MIPQSFLVFFHNAPLFGVVTVFNIVAIIVLTIYKIRQVSFLGAVLMVASHSAFFYFFSCAIEQDQFGAKVINCGAIIFVFACIISIKQNRQPYYHFALRSAKG